MVLKSKGAIVYDTGFIPIGKITVNFRIEGCKIEYINCELNGLTSLLITGLDIQCRPDFPTTVKCGKGKKKCKKRLIVEVDLYQIVGIALGKFGSAGVRWCCGTYTFVAETGCSKKCCKEEKE